MVKMIIRQFEDNLGQMKNRGLFVAIQFMAILLLRFTVEPY